jgi:hypothetical protein
MFDLLSVHNSDSGLFGNLLVLLILRCIGVLVTAVRGLPLLLRSDLCIHSLLIETMNRQSFSSLH